MRLHLPPDLLLKLRHELRRAGAREIGGVLVGEHVGEAEFRVVDLSVQRSGGDTSCFVRRPEQHAGFLREFFARTGETFERFNYLGEWHSHPNFPVQPSATDLNQMQQIVTEGTSAPLFAVLLVVRLGDGEEPQLRGAVFRPHKPPAAVDLKITERPPGDPPSQPVGWWRRLLMRRPRLRRPSEP